MPIQMPRTPEAGEIRSVHVIYGDGGTEVQVVVRLDRDRRLRFNLEDDENETVELAAIARTLQGACRNAVRKRMQEWSKL